MKKWQIANAIQRLDVRLYRGKNRIFVASWREGKNFGDDYLSIAFSKYLRRKYPFYKVVETNLHLDRHRLTEKDFLIIAGGGLWGPCGSGCLEARLYEKWMSTPARLVIANIGVESFDPSSTEQLVKLSCKTDLFTVRDRKSWLILKEILGDKVAWADDNTYLEPLQVQRSPIKKNICVNLCGPEQEDYLRNYSTDAIVQSIRKLGDLGYDTKAVVFTYKRLRSDYQYCRQVDPGCSRSFCLKRYEDCEIFVGMHFHSVILALQNCIPVIAISYSDKVNRVMQEYGLEAYCLEPEDRDLFETIRSRIETMKTEAIIARIQAGNAEARRRLVRFEDDLQHILRWS